jgi:rsbT co-antagonist protein RsbR
MPNLAKAILAQRHEILTEWAAELKKSGMLQSGRIKEAELQTECANVFNLLLDALEKDRGEASRAAYERLQDVLADISRSRALQGFSAKETATFVFSLKQPVFAALNRAVGMDPAALVRNSWAFTLLVDELGLYTMEAFQKSREEVIARQQLEIAELSTPVVKLWDGILALPVIGTLDSQRTQVMMENLLQSIVTEAAEIAIIDITGVPTVDTLTAQHLLKTISAARLMGADCIISGIRPQIAQTIVHIGVDLNVISKSTLADAFALALRRVGRKVTAIKTQARDSASDGE